MHALCEQNYCRYDWLTIKKYIYDIVVVVFQLEDAESLADELVLGLASSEQIHGKLSAQA